MKERPMIFSGESVRAMYADRKTQTRRVVKLPPAPMRVGVWEPTTIGGAGVVDSQGNPAPDAGAVWHRRTGKCLGCPYGWVGDRLWVKETFVYDGAKRKAFLYRATSDREALSWQSPLYMPRRAARLILAITNVRVERLQDISPEDCRAEGIEPDMHLANWAARLRSHFQAVWDALNKDRGFPWESNPFVWVLSFRRLSETQRDGVKENKSS